ncbi:hypothetical protein VFPBJ_06666 [Purpureocillium lilacinum]|uniref:Uncharacterized protein n=1 Tax=Purpureocillium lilacinum TaxID=33203 RepID=A0A179GKY1_PURLI|nr:hypothetical protein VFPBJ_06666 [Purpureocillium lilacinum]
MTTDRPAPPKIEEAIHAWLTVKEEKEIRQQFQKACVRNRQVLWSGMLGEVAQEWADEHGFQTLTTAMGPLMDPNSPTCPKHKKGLKSWPKYVHGASAVFAYYIAQGDIATVLSQPPPQRFHPSGLTYYQIIEEPILKGKYGNRPVKKIVVVHPTVGKAAEFTYELWPHDEPSLWTASFGIPDTVRYWRQVKLPRKESKVNALEPWDRGVARVI